MKKIEGKSNVKVENSTTPVQIPDTPKPRSEKNRKRIGAFLEKREQTQPPSLKYVKSKKSLEPVDHDLLMLRVGLSEAFATVNQDLQNVLYAQISRLFPHRSQSKAKEVNAFLAILHKIKPRDELEAMLATQMIATHIMIMEFMNRISIPDQTHEGVSANTDRAAKMERIFITQLETLNKYRGKGSQQKVIVEHVTVNSGGQAIVGQVNQDKSDAQGGRG
jgi:hypothetical protein